MILIGLGANLPNSAGEPPRATLEAALVRLGAEEVRILARSAWYETEPIPRSDQPNFVNGVVKVMTGLDPANLLDLLHRIEEAFGRVRGARNAARPIDLDLLDYDGIIRRAKQGPILPHPRMHQRAFVLLPLREVAPSWRHPGTGLSIDELIAALPPGQSVRPIL